MPAREKTLFIIKEHGSITWVYKVHPKKPLDIAYLYKHLIAAVKRSVGGVTL